MTVAEVVFVGLWVFTILLWMYSMRIWKQWVTVALKLYGATHGIPQDE